MTLFEISLYLVVGGFGIAFILFFITKDGEKQDMCILLLLSLVVVFQVIKVVNGGRVP